MRNMKFDVCIKSDTPTSMHGAHALHAWPCSGLRVLAPALFRVKSASLLESVNNSRTTAVKQLAVSKSRDLCRLDKVSSIVSHCSFQACRYDYLTFEHKAQHVIEPMYY